MPIPQLSPKEAKETLENHSSSIYVDVRSIPEFQNGHPEGAINIPLLNAQGGQMVPNPDFVKVVKSTFQTNKKLIVGCQSGGRSQRACEILTAEGYEDLSNVAGGFGAWKGAGLPVSTK